MSSVVKCEFDAFNYRQYLILFISCEFYFCILKMFLKKFKFYFIFYFKLLFFGVFKSF
jgi:hypothetical protein